MLKRYLPFLFLLAYGCGNSQEFDASCAQQKAVINNLYANHFAPPLFNHTTNLQVLDLFLKEADDRNIIFLSSDKIKFEQTLAIAEGADAFCLLTRKAYAIFDMRLKQLDSMIALIEKKPLEFKNSDTITFLRTRQERIFCFSPEEVNHRLEKRIKYETLTGITMPNRDSTEVMKQSSAGLAELKENAKKKSIRRLKQFLSEFNNEKFLLQHISDCMSNAIAQRCDPHSNFFNIQQLESYQNALSTEEISFGFSAGEDENGNIIIEDLVPGGPAWKSDKLHEKDILISFKFENEAEVELDYLELEDFQDLFYKSTGQSVELTVMKKDYNIKTVKLKKELIRSQENVLNSYVVSLGYKKFGYIPIPSFYLDQENDSRQGCANDVAKEIIELKQDSITGLIIDLRYNGGGSMREAIGLAGIFIDEGPVAVYKPRDGKPFVLKDLNRGSIWNGPLVLLVNSASASASEFVTATLQDYNRAIIVGSTTFGKGTAQSVLLIDSSYLNTNLNKMQSLKSYMKITGGKFYRITGESHQAKGIVPDIVLPGIIEQVMEKEIDYPYHLACDSVDKKVIYRKLPELPRVQLNQLSNKRVSADKKFGEIKNTGDSLAGAKLTDEKIALNLIYFKKYADKQKNFNIKIGRIFTDTTNNSLEIINNTANNRIVSMSEYQTRNNENAIGSLKKDLILHECIYILNDLVKLSKNQPK